MRKGLELFGDQSEEATNNDLHHFYDFGMYIPMDVNTLSREGGMKALSSLMFIVDKRDGRVKARNCDRWQSSIQINIP